MPAGANSWGEYHWCVGAIVMHANDLPLTTEAQRSSNVAIRNFNTTKATTGLNLIVAATNYLDDDAELKVFVNPLPAGWRVVMPPRAPAAPREGRLTSIGPGHPAARGEKRRHRRRQRSRRTVALGRGDADRGRKRVHISRGGALKIIHAKCLAKRAGALL